MLETILPNGLIRLHNSLIIKELPIIKRFFSHPSRAGHKTCYPKTHASSNPTGVGFSGLEFFNVEKPVFGFGYDTKPGPDPNDIKKYANSISTLSLWVNLTLATPSRSSSPLSLIRHHCCVPLSLSGLSLHPPLFSNHCISVSLFLSVSSSLCFALAFLSFCLSALP